MTKKRVKINFAGQQLDAEQVRVEQCTERWNEYRLDDGTLLKLKLLLATVHRVEGRYDAEGNPMYAIQSTNMICAEAPRRLQQKARRARPGVKNHRAKRGGA
jgi:hypothetical protein